MFYSLKFFYFTAAGSAPSVTAYLCGPVVV
jgi:hypothetical protein